MRWPFSLQGKTSDDCGGLTITTTGNTLATQTWPQGATTGTWARVPSQVETVTDEALGCLRDTFGKLPEAWGESEWHVVLLMLIESRLLERGVEPLTPQQVLNVRAIAALEGLL